MSLIQRTLPQIIPTLRGSTRKQEIWCVAAGKGGVGKSFISSSLGIALAKLGYSTTFIDLDLGGANLHTCLGSSIEQKNIRNFFENPDVSLADLITPTSIPKTYLIPGLTDAWNPLEASFADFQRFKTQLSELKTNFVILDLGAGALAHNIEFFNFADRKILVSTPDPSSVENTYRYFEGLIYKLIQNDCSPTQLEALIQQMRANRSKNSSVNTAKSLIHKLSPQGQDLLKNIESTQISFILNQVRTPEEKDLGQSIEMLVQRYFGFSFKCIGHVDYDIAVWQSLRNRRPPILDNPFSRVVGQISLLTRHLVQNQKIDLAA